MIENNSAFHGPEDKESKMDRLFQEKLAINETDFPFGNQSWDRLNAMLDAKTDSKKSGGARFISITLPLLMAAASLLIVAGAVSFYTMQATSGDAQLAMTEESFEVNLTPASEITLTLPAKGNAAVEDEKSNSTFKYSQSSRKHASKAGRKSQSSLLAEASAGSSAKRPNSAMEGKIFVIDPSSASAPAEGDAIASRATWSRELPNEINVTPEYLAEFDSALPPVRVQIQFAGTGWKTTKSQLPTSVTKRGYLASQWELFRRKVNAVWNLKNGQAVSAQDLNPSQAMDIQADEIEETNQ